MEILFFGDYLLQKGLISTHQLNAAADYQLAHNKPVGKIALEENLLNENQIDKIKDIQKVEDKRFGQIALDIGYLTDSQLDVILDKQKKVNIVFGDVLYMQGVLTLSRISEEVSAFKKFQKNKFRHVYTELAFCDKDHLLEDSVSIFKTLFYRSFQEHIKFRKVDFVDFDRKDIVYLSQRLTGDMQIQYIFSFEKSIKKIFNIALENENDLLDLFYNFMESFTRRIALFLSTRDIIVKTEECDVLEVHILDFSNFEQIRFITTFGEIALYIKV